MFRKEYRARFGSDSEMDDLDQPLGGADDFGEVEDWLRS
jgi:hypothetical protein